MEKSKTNNNPADKGLKPMSGEIALYGPGYAFIKDGNEVVVPQSKPLCACMIQDIYEKIRDYEFAGKETDELHTITDKKENSRYKLLKFYHATFACFSERRREEYVKTVTGYMVLDFDAKDIRKNPEFAALSDKQMVRKLRRMLLKDSNIDTVLMFTSPNGNGVKWVIYIGAHEGLTHAEVFAAISAYIFNMYGIETDKSGSDIIRTCFICFDRGCYIAPDLGKLRAPRINLAMWIAHLRLLRHQACKAQRTSFTGYAKDVFELVERFVSRDTAYAPGTYNRYVSKCGYLLCEYGVPESEAEDWAVSRFSDYESSDVRSIFRSCYRGGTFGKRQFQPRG